MASGRTKGRTAHGPGRARAAEEAFWEETGASHYREAEELARSLHKGR